MIRIPKVGDPGLETWDVAVAGFRPPFFDTHGERHPAYRGRRIVVDLTQLANIGEFLGGIAALATLI